MGRHYPLRSGVALQHVSYGRSLPQPVSFLLRHLFMTLAEYRKSCWPKYNPFYGRHKESFHLIYLNCVWGEGPYEAQRKYFVSFYRVRFPGVPLGQLNLKAIFV